MEAEADDLRARAAEEAASKSAGRRGRKKGD
jgi:hypothetical protein